MQRRKYLAAIGSLAAGGAALIGTGATSTTAQRGFSATVTGGASANLGIIANTESDFVSKSSPLSIDFEGDQNQNGGLNQNAVTTVRPAFTLQNNFSNDLYVEINNPLRNDDITSSQINNHAGATNGDNTVTVPAGLDIQFLAASQNVVDGTGSNSSKVDLIDRSIAPKSSNGPDGGNDFQEEVSPATIKTDLDTLNPGGNIVYLRDEDAGYIKIAPGSTTHVIARAIVNGYAGAIDTELTSAPFNIRAFTEESSMSLGTDEVATY